jgi:very-short-patch-repair endonuclease
VAVATRLCPDSDGENPPRSLDPVIAALAARQHGVVSRAQLLAAGLGRGAIDRRLSTARLHAVHRGVFAVGHPVLTRHGIRLAAVLAGGDGAVLSHRSAAELWGIRNGARKPIEVIVAGYRGKRPGVQYHRIALPADEITVEQGIPTTNPARTLFDLSSVLTQQQLEHALNEAEIRRLTSPLSLDALIARHPRRKGTQALRRALEKHGQHGETVTKSDFETAFLDFTEHYGLPRPRMNEPLGPYFPDAFWPAQRLIVELDSYDIHTTRQAFEEDRALTTAGYKVIRVSYRQLSTDPSRLARQLRTLLTT